MNGELLHTEIIIFMIREQIWQKKSLMVHYFPEIFSRLCLQKGVLLEALQYKHTQENCWQMLLACSTGSTCSIGAG